MNPDLVDAVGSRDAEWARGAPAGSLSGRLLSGRWRVGRLLGRGGMSVVYEAIHRNGNRVAIKVLRVDREHSERTRRRFMREGYLANRVGHAGVVMVLDDDLTDDGATFLVMELLEGVNLEQFCAKQGGQMAPEAVLAVANAVLDILVAAHAKQIIHRDIKPSNLFLTRSGQLKLLDFGIASFRERSANLLTTGEGVFLGTAGFMAPEQARGRWKDVDARTDLWAVGALMFRLLTGRLVHETDNSNEYVVAAATTSAPSLASVAPSQSLGIVEMVDRALKSDPALRFQTALEMQRAVRVEMSRFADCRLPTATEVSLATCDETVNTSLENAPLGQGAPESGHHQPRRAPAIWRFAVLGMLVGVVLVYFLRPHRESPNVRGGRAPESVELPTSRAPESMPLASDGWTTATASNPSAPLAVVPVGAVSAPSREPPTARRALMSGTGSAKTPRPHATPASASPTAPVPARFEDVLDERR